MVSSPDHLRSDHGGRAHVDMFPDAPAPEREEYSEDHRADG